MHRRSSPIAVIALVFSLVGGARAADLVVHVDGLPAAEGEVTCGLFVDAAGFPDDDTRARTETLPANPGGTKCRFAGVAAGRVAIAVSHDRNGNGRLDKNFLGIPREPWGVSNGVRPSLRPPRFAEAAFEMPAEGVLELRVAVAQ